MSQDFHPINQGPDTPDDPAGLDELRRMKRQLVETLAELSSARDEIAALKAQLGEYPEQLEAMVKERTRELEAVNRIAATVNRSLNLDVILRDSLEKVLDLLELQAGSVFLVDENRNELNLMVHRGFPADMVEKMMVSPINGEFPGAVALRDEPVLIEDGGAGENGGDNILCGQSELSSCVGIPLESKGKVRGVMCIMSDDKGRFGQQELKLLVTIGREIGVAIENAWLYEKSYAHSKKMEELSITDSLTQLFNRRHFYQKLKEEMARARRQGHPLTLLVVDLDNLKDYNDKHGHVKGDEALRGVAQAITASIRHDVDTGYRYGGDEFALILPYSDSNEAAVVAERIRKTFEDFSFPETSLSLGLAQFDFQESLDDLVTRADTAMYVAKNFGGNKVHIV